MTDIKLLKQIREETQASIVDIKKALEETKDDYKKALEWLKKHGIEKAEKKQDRETSQGLVESYIHQNGKVGAMVILLCETDFVAKTDEFKKLAHEVAMQVVAMNPKDVAALLKQEYIRDNSLTIEKLVKSVIGKLGENITVKNISRLEI
ncbi:MAG: translation elongation factor Ts [Candidatus Levybacteria bacterium CG_4_9_14_3_um_filter_35_16]|nr:MAG: translation elongation factor Ts [Candidatus Levybacteria bacterium CG22_combo_CG10-13_8_21_14_all_35_11]PIZ98109.1 MAG: translation elongation factor Ts [Candidatus Levybacteria bacterium CG_4_10_14_0_2_um_filter_35_8]PJA91556.1 MAG: translation elongation factor Ts [Candidatus Levybacteria bacterium CG_4_9_14_3_um_filter_35_16]PJC54374.1 MAG: translation elongation factor Ts [Candidatus Levybacteria bacterium CG_4_9_14_0_2_um_filter_35_21]